ncbi:hypothetical protein BCR37DRAFT_392774 [Protomyces lactucae-debilis]|uniref:Uncharacterized protein n=1 Tax=Protomyces lactucae-debilis TaxID=2754530 RepID=A0A1Y2FH16_PROLT|nr:uncharacterized protein BCR37DRAFT_392774 [Protomyces lactucae-debilis]ORY82566.1 hypothetical protein BCR37DRAFT_392774 [Protomyces lactucae-debilis]
MLDVWVPMRAASRRDRNQQEHKGLRTHSINPTLSSEHSRIAPTEQTQLRQPPCNHHERTQLTSFLTALSIPALSLSFGKTLATRHSQRALRALARRPRYIPAHDQQPTASSFTSWLSEEHRQTLAQFRQVLLDIQDGTATSDREVQAWFMQRAVQLQGLYQRTPLVVKTLAFQILPLKAIPKMEDLSKPGAMMALVRHVFYRCRERLPWLLSNASLLTLALLIVALLVSHSYLRGKSARLAQEEAYARKMEERRKFLEMYPEGHIVDDPFWRETSVPAGPFRGVKL